MKILFLLLLIRIALANLYQLYLFQLKEYRWDRFNEHVKRIWKSWFNGAINIGFLAPFSLKKLPKVTSRSGFVFFLSLCFLLALAIWGGWPVVLSSLFLPANMILAVLIVGLTDRIALIFLRKAAGKVVANWKKKGTIIVGVTGSFGKTTTVDLLGQLLDKEIRVLSPSSGTNTEKAIAIFVFSKRNFFPEIFIAEIGAYKKGEIASVVSWLKPEVGVVTGIGRQHLSLFGSEKNILVAKSEILPFCRVAFFNADSPGCRQIGRRFSGKKYFYGRHKYASVRITASKNNLFRQKNVWRGEQEMIMQLDDKRIEAKLPFLGRELLTDLAGAIAVANYLGISLKRIKEKLPLLHLAKKRLEVRTGPTGCLIVDSTYNQSEESLLTGIGLFRGSNFPKKIAVISPLIEMGERTSKIYPHLAKKLISVFNLVFTNSPDLAAVDPSHIKLFKDKQLLKNLIQKKDKEAAIFLSGRDAGNG